MGKSHSRQNDIIFRQLFDTSGSSTYSYLLADVTTRAAVLIDPVLEMVDRDLKLIEDLQLDLEYVMNTHCHADHITGSGLIKDKLQQQGKKALSVISKDAGARADWLLEPGTVVKVGSIELEARATPGHTSGCMTFVTTSNGGMAFTGDALLIRGCGRTDFQQGDSGQLYDSVHAQIFSLPGEYKVYPAHDYKGQTVSSVDEERTLNPRLTKDKAAFVDLMANLNLPYPQKIDASLPRNLVCGYNE